MKRLVRPQGAYYVVQFSIKDRNGLCVHQFPLLIRRFASDEERGDRASRKIRNAGKANAMTVHLLYLIQRLRNEQHAAVTVWVRDDYANG